MYNFTVGFEYPWLLLLLIPALFFTLFHYFRSAKKYRRNRNRIISMVMHMLVMLLCISVLSGISFMYDVPNTQNQVLLLVDMSDSSEYASDRRDSIVADILDESDSQYSVGVVLFGYDQVLAAPLSTNADDVYRRYESAALPDRTATDIAAALNFARTVITNPDTAKIVLISDGLQTDGDALTAVRSVAADNIRVDTVAITLPETAEVEIVDVAVPDYNVIVGDTFTMTVRLKTTIGSSDAPADAVLTLYDNDEEAGSVQIALTGIAQEVDLQYAFDTPGMHRLSFSVSNADDTLTENNAYYSYINIAVFDRILVIERNNGESEELVSILKDGTGYTVDVLNVSSDAERMPKTVNDLREYDEVILVNIANADMPEGFDVILNDYVSVYGGGLFTVGGNNEDDEANTYVREDMEGTLYQQMLPVQAINYTPPLGVVFLLDISGSMFMGSSASGKLYIDLAQEAIASCVQYSLSERDYCGIMALAEPVQEISPVLPVPRMSTIIASMEKIDNMPSNGTPYASSIRAAGAALMSLTMVEKRHIVIVSDGEPTDAETEYTAAIKEYAERGVTITIVNIGLGGYDETLEKVAEMGNGRYIKISDIQELTSKMRQELETDEIKAYNPKTYTPIIRQHTSVVSGITQDDMPELDGFYGTKIKSDATSVLVGEYVPVYAQWKYGEGSVGSFMCDLNGTWSSKWLASTAGQQILKNIAVALFPTKDIRPSEIEVSLNCGNYSTVMSVYTDLEETERIEAVYMSGNGSAQTTTPIVMNPDNGYTRATFVIKDPGIHEVVVRKLDADGNILATSSVYRVFSYSKEYEVLTDEDGAAFMAELAQKGKGTSVNETWEIFEGFEKSLHIVYDPRLVFCIVALVLFLVDIAVRKFKFKWPHELLREYRAQKKDRQS